MSLTTKRGLHVLLTDRAEGSTAKGTSGSQPLSAFPPPPPLANPFTPANLKKKRKEKDMAEEGELILQKEGDPPKQQKTARGRARASSVESKGDQNVVEVHL